MLLILWPVHPLFVLLMFPSFRCPSHRLMALLMKLPGLLTPTKLLLPVLSALAVAVGFGANARAAGALVFVLITTTNAIAATNIVLGPCKKKKMMTSGLSFPLRHGIKVFDIKIHRHIFDTWYKNSIFSCVPII